MRINFPFKQDFENLPAAEMTDQNQKKILKKPLVIFVSVFGAVLLLLVIVAVFMGFNQKGDQKLPVGKPTPTPMTEFKEEISSPSPYATDAAVLKIEQEIKSLEQKIQNTDLKESDLNPPALDWGLKFEE